MGDNDDRLNFAVIGLGWVAENRHIPCILRNPDTILYGAIDRKRYRVEEIEKKFKPLISSVSEEGKADWLDPVVDAVVITTDPKSHYKLAKQFLESGKHVLVEKPFCLTVEQGQDLAECTSRSKRVCAVAHNFQFSHSVIKLKNKINNGSLGDIIGVEAVQWSNPRRRLPTWYEDLPLGLFFDESPHLLYLIRCLELGQISLLSAVERPSSTGRNTPSLITAHYSVGNIPVRITLNFEAALSEWHLAVFGSKKTCVVDVFRDELVVIPNDGTHRAHEILRTSGWAIGTHLLGTFASGIRILRRKLYYGTDRVYNSFVQAIYTNQKPHGISDRDGIEVVRMQNEIFASLGK